MAGFEFDFSFVRSGSPIVTFSAIGLSFNAGARGMLGYPARVDIGYDEKANAIGVRAHTDGSEVQAYEFESRVKDNWVRISAKDFMRYLSQKSGIDFITKSKQFLPFFDDDNKMLIVMIDKEHLK